MNSKNKNTHERDYDKQISELKYLLKIFGETIEANAGQPINGLMRIDAEAEFFAIKSLTAAISAVQIYNSGFKIRIGDKNLIGYDFSTVQIIARSCMELYLIFFWLLKDKCDDDELKFRYLSWKSSGLSIRTRFEYTIQNHVKIINKEKIQLEDYIKTIFSTDYFKKLSPKQQKLHLKKIKNGDPGRPTWRSLFNAANLSKKLYLQYSFFCDYSHSGSISSNQLQSANDAGNQRNMCHMALNTISLFISLLIYDFASIFPKSNEYLSAHSEAIKLINRNRFAAENM